MNIELRALTITNFKGIKSLVVNFNPLTTISGRNEAGKSTIFNAFCWLMWGKNAEDDKSFSIKNTVDTSLNRADHEVIGVLDVDGSEVILKRVYREKWVTKRGVATTEFTGHETDFFYNGVPCSLKEYNDKVNAIIPESIAKLITNPFAFNGLKWEQRREVLVKIAGDVSDSDLAIGNKDFTDLLQLLNGKTLSDFKKETAAKKKKIRETLDLIPARIDESSRSKPDAQDFDFIERSIANKRKLIEKSDLAISDKVNAHREASVAIIKKQNEQNRVKMELQNLEAVNNRNEQRVRSQIETDISTFETSIKSHKAAIPRATTEINHLKTKIEKLEKETEEGRVKWRAINAEVMPPMAEDATTCPSCSQTLPVDRIDTIKAEYETKWNTDKLRRLAAIKGQGSANNTQVAAMNAEIEEHQTAITAAETNIAGLEIKIKQLQDSKTELVKPVTESAEIKALKAQIAAFDTITPPQVDDAELKARKAELQAELNVLVVSFGKKEQIEKIDARIKELETQEKELAQQIADLERTEFTIDKFVRAKMDMVEQRVNSMFANVTFRMFSQNINGGFEACCDCLYKGVPWPDVNTAGKIQSGLEIIGVLSGYYSTYAPVWIDNRESCADIPPIASQIINLVHVPGKALTIE